MLHPSKKAFQDDSTLIITRGPLPPLARLFTVTASGAASEKLPEFPGVYRRTQRWWFGRPVYTNTQGKLLYHDNSPGTFYDSWVIGDALGAAVLRGSWCHHSPSSEDNWTYWTGTQWKPASVTVISSN